MHTKRGCFGAAILILAIIWSFTSAETIVHSTPADFAGGTFADMEDTGSGAAALKIVYNALPFTSAGSFGNGHDGTATISGDPNARASCSGTIGTNTLTTALNANADDVVLVHQSRGSGAGAWELHKVVSDNGATLTLANNLSRTYTDSSSDQSQAILVPQYSSLTITGGGPAAWNGDIGGIYAVLCSGTITVSGTLSSYAGGFRKGGTLGGTSTGGCSGSANYNGEGTGGDSSASRSSNGNGGGAGLCEGSNTNAKNASGGGGGSNGGAGSRVDQNGSGGPSCGAQAGGEAGGTTSNASFSVASFGGAGGTGGRKQLGQHYGNPGGNGGGLIILLGRSVVRSGGLVTANGENGSQETWTAAGGGGAGGACLVRAKAVTLGSNGITATGGSGGARQDVGGAGGTGGAGLIRIESVDAISGTTNPTYNPGSIVFKTSGQYTSPPLATAGCTAFGTIAWSASGGTSVQFRVRAAATSVALSSATWSDPLTTSGSAIGLPPNEWLQYEIRATGTTNDSPLLSSVTITYATNNPPTAPSSPSPADAASVADNTPTLSWTASTDLDDDPITYDVTLDDDADLLSPIVSHQDVGSGTQYTAAMLADGIYYWQVRAYDGEDYTSSPFWSFTVDTQPPAGLSIDSMVCDFVQEGISELRGTGESGTTITLEDLGGQPIAGSATWNVGRFAFVPATPIVPGTMLRAISEDAAGNTTVSPWRVSTFESFVNTFRDDSISVSGHSLRLEQATRYVFKVAVNGGQLVTVTAQMRHNIEYGADPAPRITLSGLGVSGSSTTVAMTAGPNTWQTVSVSGNPSAGGVLTLTVETYSTTAGAKSWIDDIGVSQ